MLDNVSPETKKVLVGAGIGAVVAIPIPIIGPIIGAVIGGGIAHMRNQRRKG